MKYEQVTSALKTLQVTDEEAGRLVGSGKLAQAIAEIRSLTPQASVRLLELVAVVDVAVARFVAAEELTRENGFWLPGETKERLLPLVGEAVPAGKVRISRLTKGSVDGQIKTELGDQAEISIAQFAATLNRLSNNLFLIN